MAEKIETLVGRCRLRSAEPAMAELIGNRSSPAIGLPEHEKLYLGVENEFKSIVLIPRSQILHLQFKI